MNWPCTMCGSRHWPNPASSCPLCNDGSDEPGEREECGNTAQEMAIGRFTREGCKKSSAVSWWGKIDKLTDEEIAPDVMSESLAHLHDQACIIAWQEMETAPSSSAWADVCAIAGFDICKNYNQKQ